MPKWPAWWGWELAFTSHLLRRMVDRRFSETDLRQMLEAARAIEPDREPGRWAVRTRHAGRDWEVIVEPVFTDQKLLVVTAYGTD